MGDCVLKVDIFAKSHVMLLFMDAAYLIYQRLLGPWLGINPIEHYMIIVQPSLITWQFLTDCQYPVMSHKISVTHN
jgi:hypothetical protein